MCNACGFYCCAWDGFEGCGCDNCPNPECWSRCPDCGELDEDCSCDLEEHWHEDVILDEED